MKVTNLSFSIMLILVCVSMMFSQSGDKPVIIGPIDPSIIDPEQQTKPKYVMYVYGAIDFDYHAWLIKYVQAYNENYQRGIKRLNNSPEATDVAPINGALLLAKTDFSIPGRSGALSITRSYNSKIWSADSDSVFTYGLSTLKYDWANTPWLGCGWDLHFGKVWAPDDSGRSWETPSGTQVYFKHKTGSDYISTDGAFKKMQIFNDSTVIKTGDGSRLLFAYVSNSIRYLTKILDPNGNITNFYYSSGYLDSLVSSTKRKAYFYRNYHAAAGAYTLDSIKYKGFGDGNNRIVFHYDYNAATQNSPFGDSYGYGCVLLKSVIYPHGDSVYYDYNSYLELQCAHSSSGGSATYEYGTYNYWIPNIAIYPPDDQTETTWKKQYTREVKRMISDDEWSSPDTTTYSRSFTYTSGAGGTYKAITNPDSIRITDPEGNYVIHNYEAARRKYIIQGDSSWGVTKGLYYYGTLDFVKFFNQNNTLTKKQIFGIEAMCRITSDSIPVIKREKYNNGLRTYQTNYYNYDSYGNPEFIHLLGDTSITTDDRWIRRSYYSNDTKYIIHCLKVDSLCSDSANYQVLSKTHYNYDETSYIVKNYNSPVQWETPPSPSDTRGNLTSMEYWKSGSDYAKTEYRYDNVGNIVYSITHPTLNTAETTFTYYDPPSDPDKYHYAFPWRAVNHVSTSACSLYTRAEYDSATGLAIMEFDANGDSTVFSYDNMNRLTKTWFPNDDAAYQRIHYKDDESPEGVIDSTYLDFNGGVNRWIVTKNFYDGFGRVLQTKQFGYEGSRTIIQNILYNGNGLIDSICNPYDISGTSYTYSSPSWTDVTTYTYDGQNRLTKIKYPTGDSIRAKYYVNVDTIFDEKGNKTAYVYNAYGDIDTVIGAINDTTVCKYDTLGRLTKVIDAKSKETKYFYDKIGRIKGVNGPDVNYCYTYDGNQVDEYYAYDDLGNLILKRDPNGWTRYTYDDIYRLTKAEFSTDSTNWSDKVRNSYDVNYGLPPSGMDNPKGRLTKLTTVGIDSTIYFYNDRGLQGLKRIDLVGLSGQKAVTYYYNYADICTLMNISPSYKTVCQFNVLGQPKAIPNLISGFSYKPSGAIYKIERPASNSVVDSFTYDTRLRPVLIHAQRSGTNVMKLKYYYEANNNVDSIADYVNTTYPQGFAYDGLNRLTNVYSSAGNQTFVYDKVGNRTSKNGISYQYWVNTNKLKLDHRGDTTYYDNNGNTIRRRTTAGTVDSFAYNWNDRLVYFKKITTGAYCDFAYNASGLRVKKHYYNPGTSSGEGQGAAGTLFIDGSSDLGIQSSGSDSVYNKGRDIKEIWAKYDANNFYFTIVNRSLLNESGKMKMFITLDIDTLENSGRITLPEDTLTKVPKKAAWEYCIYISDDDYGLYKKDGTKVAQPFGMAVQKVFGDSGQIKLKISRALLDNIPAIRYTIATFNPNAVNSDSLWQGGSSAADVFPGTPETFGGEINGYGQISPTGITKVSEYTIYYIYNGIEPIAEYSSDGTLLARYVYANGMHIAKIAGADTTWYHCDALGSPRKITNESGTVTWTGAYYPFGEMLSGSGNVHGFTGKELDSESGLNYFCQRYYDSQIGRFMNLDEWTCLPDDQRNFSATAYLSWNSHQITYKPKHMQANQVVSRSKTIFNYGILPDAVSANNRPTHASILSGPLFIYNSGIRTLGMIHQLNRYQYCYNNPLRYIDPTGDCPLWLLMLATEVALGFKLNKTLREIYNTLEPGYGYCYELGPLDLWIYIDDIGVRHIEFREHSQYTGPGT